MQPETIAGLVFKYLQHSLTPEEEQRLTRWRNIDNINEDFFQMILTYVKEGTLHQEYELRESAIWEKLCAKIPALKDCKN